MNRRRALLVGLSLWAGSLWAGAQVGQNVLVMDSASTTANFPYAITVDVTVENRGQAPTTAGTLEVTLRPRVSRGSKPVSDVPTMWDPVTNAQPVPALQPGEKKVFTFRTPYQSKNSFKNMRGSFKVNNIEATGSDVTVGVTSVLR